MPIMNKKLICLLMFVFSLGLAFTACSDDDDKKETGDYAKDIEASYGGTLSIPAFMEGGSAVVIKDKDIVVTRTAENKAKVVLADLSIPMNETSSFPVGTITVDNIEVSKSGTTYTLKETTSKVTVKGMDGKDVEATVKMSGTVKDGKMALKIYVTDVPVVETLDITFAGDKKEAGVDYAKNVAGTYNGILNIPPFMEGGSAVVIEDRDIVVTRTADNKAKVVLEDLSIPMNETSSFPVGTITVDNIEVSYTGITYTLKETTSKVTVKGMDGEDVEATVKMSGTVVDGKMALKIYVTDVPVVETLDIDFVGDKK